MSYLKGLFCFLFFDRRRCINTPFFHFFHFISYILTLELNRIIWMEMGDTHLFFSLPTSDHFYRFPFCSTVRECCLESVV